MFSILAYFIKKGCLLLLISLVLSPVLYCRKPNLRFQGFTVEQGLAQNAVFCILQDQKGFMWFGTEQGLNRFDGYNFVAHRFQYDNPNSLTNSYIQSIHEDSSGILWIGTDGGGLNKFDPEINRFTGYLIDPESLDSLANIINVIFEDRSGGLWIGTGGEGLKKFDPKREAFTHFPVNCRCPDKRSHNTINVIFEDDSGTLWIGTDGGLNQLDPEMKQIKPVDLPIKKVLAVYRYTPGELWVGTDNGFYKIEAGTGQFVHYRIPSDDKNFTSVNTIRVFYRDRLGTFWIGTDYGLHIFDRRENTYHSFYADANDPHSLVGNGVRAIYEDLSGALWVGVYSGGLNKLNRTGQTFNHYYSNPKNPDSLINRDVFAIYEDREGVLWIGTYGEGLNAFNRRTGEFSNYRNHPDDPHSLSDNRVWSICEDRQGMLWIGTAEGGLNQFSRKTGKFTRFRYQPENPHSLSSSAVSSIIEDQKGVLWIGTNGGLDKLVPRGGQFVHFQTNPKDANTLVHNNVYVIYEDRGGMLWIGTKGGLSTFDPESETFTSYPANSQESNVLSHHSIFSICEDKQGVIWLGTTNGLNRFDRESNTFSYYREKDGLPNDVINGILEDDQGNLWLSTNKGLSKFNPRTGTFNNYSAADGLQGSEFNGGAYYKSRRGELFFGGINGFNAFFPGSVKDNPYIPPVVITDFKIFNQSIPVGKTLNGRMILEKSITAMDAVTLSHRDYIFSFDFAALNYIHSEKNEYAYMMKGIEKSWNYVGQRRFVTYANLAPGDYVFRVKASNNHGVWNEEGVSLKIKVLPPLWATWWFKLSLVFLVVFLVFMAYRVRTRLILRRNRELEDIVARRTTALKESWEKYRTVVDRAHSGIAIVQDDVIVFENTRFARLLGYDEKDIVNRPLVQFVAAERESDINGLLADCKNEKKLRGNFETILRHKDGGNIYVEINCGSITYKKQPALLMFFHDIRMQKLLAEELMKTAKLESTSALAGGIAHDFNNLLAIILGNIELALGYATPGDSIHKALANAEKTCMNAVELVRQFITLSRSNIPIKKTGFVRDIVPDAVHSVLQGSNVVCESHLPGTLWPVACDAQQIKQAIRNIVINAKQAMPDDGVLQVRAQNQELGTDEIPGKTPGKYVCISIKDNGTGISREDLPKIFDPYFSTRENVTQKGLGLGLAVVHSIITGHEGTIDVTSEKRVGTTVRICLPISTSTSIKSPDGK